jgi:hypothetical protein
MKRVEIGDAVYIKGYPKEWGIVQDIINESTTIRDPIKLSKSQEVLVFWHDGEKFAAYTNYLVKV